MKWRRWRLQLFRFLSKMLGERSKGKKEVLKEILTTFPISGKRICFFVKLERGVESSEGSSEDFCRQWITAQFLDPGRKCSQEKTGKRDVKQNE